MILRDSRLTRHPSCLTNGVHLRRGKADDLGTLHARLDKLAELVELARLSQSEDRARMEHTRASSF
jgi:hypothetical protein